MKLSLWGKISLLVFFVFLTGISNVNVVSAQNEQNSSIVQQAAVNTMYRTAGTVLGGVAGPAGSALGGAVASTIPTSASQSKDPDGVAEMIVYGLGRLVTLVLTGIGGLWLWLTGMIFDGILQLTVVEIGSDKIKNIFLEPVENLWKIFRDFGNLIIIFSLLFLAIKTIFNGDGFADKKAIGGILIAAILINFSLFFVKLTFDVSNIVSLSILNSINANNGATTQGASISSQIASTYDYKAVVDMSYNNAKNFMDRMSRQVTNSVFSLILMFVTGCIFVASCGFLIIRFLVFLLLMITSPIGFVGKFIPYISTQTKAWWDQLWKQAIALPVFVLMLYVAVIFIQSTQGESKLGFSLAALFTGNTTAIGQNLSDSMMGIFSLFISLGLLIAAVIVPGMIGGAGAKMIASGTAKTGAFMGRRMIDSGRYSGKAIGWGARKAGVDVDKIKGKMEKATSLTLKDGIGKGALGFAARRAVDTKEALKDKTFDFRNISIGAKTIGEKYSLGKGSKSYREIVEEKEKEVSKDLERTNKRYNLDRQTPEEKAKAAVEQQAAKDQIDTLSIQNKDIIKQYNNSGGENGPNSHLYLQQISQNQKEIEKLQNQVNKSKNPGIYSAQEINNSGINRLINVITGNFEKNRALSSAISKQEKQWNKSSEQKLMADLKKALSDNKDKGGDEKKS